MISWRLTRQVDGLQTDSSGSDEATDPLQLALPYVVLEDDVIGEVDIADGLEGGRALAGEWDAAVLRIILDSHGLGHWALIVLHHGQK